jgi:sec-independent protein translocase protein TatA
MTRGAPDFILFALSAPGMGEWAVILILVLVLFGGKNIPDLARSIGKGVREFKRAMNGIGDPPDPDPREHDASGPPQKKDR